MMVYSRFLVSRNGLKMPAFVGHLNCCLIASALTAVPFILRPGSFIEKEEEKEGTLVFAKIRNKLELSSGPH